MLKTIKPDGVQRIFMLSTGSPWSLNMGKTHLTEHALTSKPKSDLKTTITEARKMQPHSHGHQGCHQGHMVTLEVRRSERPRELRPRCSRLPSVSIPDGGPLDGKPPPPLPPPPAPPPPPSPLLLFSVCVPLRMPPLRLPRELRLKSDERKWRYGRALKVGVGEAEPAV